MAGHTRRPHRHHGLGLTAPAQATARTTTVTTVYVANLGSDSIATINAATGTAGHAIGVPGEPYLLAATPDGSTSTWTPGTTRSSPLIPPRTRQAPILLRAPTALAFTPDGKTLLALIGTERSSVVPINTATNTAATPIPAGNYATASSSPGQQEAYVRQQRRHRITVDLTKDTAGTAIPVGAGRPARRPSRSPRTAIPLRRARRGAGIVPISTATDTAGPAIYAPGQRFLMQLTPDGKTLWALAVNGFLDRVNVAASTLHQAIRIRGDLDTLTLTPRTVYVGQPLAWGRLVPVNAVTGIRGPDIPGARFISAAALSPDGSTVWAPGFDTRTVLPVSVATGKPGRPVPVGRTRGRRGGPPPHLNADGGRRASGCSPGAASRHWEVRKAAVRRTGPLSLTSASASQIRRSSPRMRVLTDRRCATSEEVR